MIPPDVLFTTYGIGRGLCAGEMTVEGCGAPGYPREDGGDGRGGERDVPYRRGVDGSDDTGASLRKRGSGVADVAFAELDAPA